MACLNLPTSIQYKPENIYFAGIVPEPEEPKLEALNYYQKCLMTDIAKSWVSGAFISQIALCPHKHLTWSIIAISIFNLSEARKAATLASFGAH